MNGATQQLRHIAAAQEKAGNYVALAATLDRIVELGVNQSDILTELAKVRGRLGQDSAAGAAWVAAADAAIHLGALKDARALIQAGLEATPVYLPLRLRQAQVASREGDQQLAQNALRIGAQLAFGAGELDHARTMLIQLRRLRPDDMFVRMQLAEVALALKDSDTERILRDVVRQAVRGNNHGLALEYARHRVSIAAPPAFEARAELIELLRRSGDGAGALTAGRELLASLLENAEFEKAIELLQRLVASNPRNVDLVLELGDLYEAVNDARQAGRYFRHAVSLLQVEQRIPEALQAIDHLVKLGFDDPTLPLAKAALEKGQAVDWEAFRNSLSQDQRRRLADEISTTKGDPLAAGASSAATGS
jgi:predicted Zn-dependent protease